MKSMFKLLEEYIPDIRDRLNKGVGESDIKKIEELSGYDMPRCLKDIFSVANGEKELVLWMMGFEQMTIDMIIDEYEYLTKNCENYDIVSDKPGYISEGSYSEGWIPFASDGSGSFILLDLCPDTKGSVGQIISLDNDCKESYVIADSLEAFLKLIGDSLGNGDLKVVGEESFIQWRDGHLFDDIEELLIGECEDDEFIILDPYFVEHLGAENNGMYKSQLAKVKEITIKDIDNRYGVVSLEPLAYMTNLKSLVFYSDADDIDAIIGLEKLTYIAFVGMNLLDDKWYNLSKIENLKEISIHSSVIEDLSYLKANKKLKSMRLAIIDYRVLQSVAELVQLKELKLEMVAVLDTSYLSKLKKLTKLELSAKTPLMNLDFLKNLKNLKEFKVEDRAMDEKGIIDIADLSKMVYLNYPIDDLSLVKGLEKLKEIKIDANTYCNGESLSKTNVSSLVIVGARDSDHVESIVEEIEEYRNIVSYQWS